MMDFLPIVLLTIIGYLSGSIIERRHFQSIRKRELQLKGILTFSAKLPPAEDFNKQSVLVSGNVVISVDYFKHISAALRNLIGGRVIAYETLMERARREAILRMKTDAKEKGASQIFNVKLETSSISKGRANQIGSVEVFAYGTGLI
ncbi:MAG: heavy metal-binding domain-containing protein [Pseudomonadales bacterium]|nr:heavy metal-binding domain-containing protein [Pseudomonadales bacterium]MDG1443477.1 heavy metal-binding domain-containing protein [Pseudomonadales bacterium]